jgi:hypothetical protein
MPLKDAAAVNATRWALYDELADTGLRVPWRGERTRFNRSRLGIAKTYALDAACVGELGPRGWNVPTLEIKPTGRGTYYCRTKRKANGSPRGYCVPAKSVRAFRTGDMARTEAPKAKNSVASRCEFAVLST